MNSLLNSEESNVELRTFLPVPHTKADLKSKVYPVLDDPMLDVLWEKKSAIAWRNQSLIFVLFFYCFHL